MDAMDLSRHFFNQRQTEARITMNSKKSKPVKKQTSRQTYQAVGVPERKKEQQHRWCQYKHVDTDRHINLVLLSRLPAKVILLFIWIASHCWDKEGSTERNPCTYKIAALANFFGVSKDCIGRYLKRLNDLGLLRTSYILKNNGTGKIKKMKYKQAWKYRDLNTGWQFDGVENHLMDGSLRVGFLDAKASATQGKDDLSEQGLLQ